MFGKYAILDEVQHNFEKDPEFWWKFKPVTADIELKLQKFLYQGRRINVDGVVREYPPTQMELQLRELSLTFGGTNIVDGDGDPFVETDDTVENIEEKLKTMPRVMIDELYKALSEATVLFGASTPPKKVKKGQAK